MTDSPYKTRGIKLLSEHVSDLKDLAANPRQRIQTGFTRLDEATLGIAQGEVMNVIARSSVGKSLFATNVIANNQDARILFYSLEMPAHLAITRLYGHINGTSVTDVMRGMARHQTLPEQINQLADTMPALVIDDRPALGLHQMSAAVESYANWFGFRPELIIIDYLEELGGGKQSGEGWVRTEASASAVKAWARQEHLAVVLLHQSNKQKQKWEPPDDNSPKGGGMTEADVMVGLWRPGWDPKVPPALRPVQRDLMAMNVIKNRITGRLFDEVRYRIDPAMRLTQETID